MSEMKPEALRKQLKNGDVGLCYLLYGKERYLAEHYRRELRKAVLGAADDPFNLRQLEGKDLDLRDLADALDAYPSFAQRALVEVRDYDIFKLPEEEYLKLLELLRDLPDYCCLLFVYEALDFKPDKRKKKLWDGLKSCASVVEFPLQGQGELSRWITRHFAARGKEISAEDASYLIFLCGSEMEILANEIGKIALYASGKRIAREEIDAVAVPAVEAQTYKLADAISAKEYDRAAELMFKLFQLNTEPIAINAAIDSQLRRLYAARLVKAAGGNAETLSQLIPSGSEYACRQYLRICNSFPESWYLRMIRLSAETDLRMKSSPEDPEDLLRSLFVTMAAEA
ncbi:MAG: DNA polymerase III subunit delta [Oscillospiraceae bacterium]|nr:DNA polymerase III subunit delta [Oscillospiraceae bacterium]